MADSTKKRKGSPGDNREEKDFKKSKGGSGGKWQTPHQQTKNFAPRGSARIEPGDRGIFITCARGQEGRATEEIKGMFAECAERFYGISDYSEGNGEEDESIDDIESSIKKEVAAMGQKQDSEKLFVPIHIEIQCVLFFKTSSRIDPADFVHRICKEVASNPKLRRMRYINRLTPMTIMGKATEKGIEEVGKAVLRTQFQLAGERAGEKIAYSYAIRTTIRNHSTLKRDAVIKQVAELVGDAHKVDLTTPDKVILIEIYQTVCGMGIVGSDWEKLKRFNLAELYSSFKSGKGVTAETTPQSVKKDEAREAAEDISATI